MKRSFCTPLVLWVALSHRFKWLNVWYIAGPNRIVWIGRKFWCKILQALSKFPFKDFFSFFLSFSGLRKCEQMRFSNLLFAHVSAIEYFMRKVGEAGNSFCVLYCTLFYKGKKGPFCRSMEWAVHTAGFFLLQKTLLECTLKLLALYCTLVLYHKEEQVRSNKLGKAF